MAQDETERRVERLRDAAWKSIAASGWNQCQLHGKGALLGSMLMLEGKSSSMDYITPSAGTMLPEWLRAAIESYNPETSIVLVFEQDDVFRRATTPAPQPESCVVSKATAVPAVGHGTEHPFTLDYDLS
jgi:hypothetical protein